MAGELSEVDGHGCWWSIPSCVAWPVTGGFKGGLVLGDEEPAEASVRGLVTEVSN
jgi:hypothetical protein